MKNKAIIPAVLLLFFIGIYFNNIFDGSIRTVEFLFIFSIGVLVGGLLTQIIKIVKDKK